MNRILLSLTLVLFASTSMAKDKKDDKAKTKGKPMLAVMETSLGTFKVKLFPEEAPKTVENFVGLAEGTIEWTILKEKKKRRSFMMEPSFTA